MSRIRVGIINVTGYAGIELARLLYHHPEVELSSVTGRSAAGQKLSGVFPHVVDIDLTITAELGEADFAFSAMPHKASIEVVLPLVEQGVKVVDISADFRLKNASEYTDWYDFVHPAPEILQKAVYGLPELHRDEIANAGLIANPGCYPTGALLALVPVVKERIIDASIIVDSKSGMSGAGRALSLTTHYDEANENVSAYALKGHRHLPEIVQELSALDASYTPVVTFLPHLVPMTRGILTSCYCQLRETGMIKGTEELKQLYRDFYKDEPFVKVLDNPPGTKYTWGSNLCLIHPSFDPKTGRVIIISCIDNLVKGAAGQAIQNMNIMCGFTEITGLEALPVYP